MTGKLCESCGMPHEAREDHPSPDGTMRCGGCGAPFPAPGGESVPGPESGEEYDRFLAGLCEPGAENLSLPVIPLRRAEPSARRSRREPFSPAGPLSPEPSRSSPEASSPAAPAPVVLPPPVYSLTRAVTLDPDRLAGNRVVAYFPESPAMEPYRVLRTRILQAAEKKGGNTIMVTSAFPGEGKTLTAVNLALTFSRVYSGTALLVDCDLRRPRVCETLGFAGERGLGDYLTGDCGVSGMLTWPGVEKLVVISGGRPVSDSSELLGSPAMKELVGEMKGRYNDRYVFFDVPAVLSGADALAFAPLVDHILFVVRAGATRPAEALRALRMLPQEKIVGVVLNGDTS